MSDLDNILSGVKAVDPAEAPQEEQPEPEKVEAAPEVPAEPETVEPEKAEEKSEDPKDIPYAVFKSTREDLKGQLDEARRELARLQMQNQPKQEPPKTPDIYEDPEGYQKYLQGTVRQQMTGQKLQMSRFFAERELGREAVDEAVKFFDQNPQLSYQFLDAPSPYHAAVEYVKAQKTAAEIGPDPVAYRERLEQEIRQKIEAEMAAKQATAMAQRKAPSMANVNGSGGQRDPGWQGPADLDSLLR